MPRAFVQLAAVTRQNRLLATDAAKDAIAKVGGWIDDFHMYSNKMTCIRCQLPASATPGLCTLLLRAGLHVDAQSQAAAAAAAAAVTANPAEICVTLQITFLHDEPDLIREVPAIPG